MNCKFCNSNQIISVRNVPSPSVNCEYTLCQCNNCKCRFFDINEHDVDIEDVNEEQSISHNKKGTVSFKKSPYWSRQVHRIEQICGGRITSILDVGCRTGDFLMHFSENIKREGVELSKSSCEIADKRGLKVYKAFVENIEFENPYDIVTCYAILEHLLYPIVFLEKLPSLVASGGVLVIMIPTHECLKRRFLDNYTSINWHMYSPPGHLNLFSKNYLDQQLSTNFKLVNRYWTSGGMFNPMRKIPFADRVFCKIMSLIDEYSPINKLPIFDHMYSYYVKLT